MKTTELQQIAKEMVNEINPTLVRHRYSNDKMQYIKMGDFFKSIKTFKNNEETIKAMVIRWFDEHPTFDFVSWEVPPMSEGTYKGEKYVDIDVCITYTDSVSNIEIMNDYCSAY